MHKNIFSILFLLLANCLLAQELTIVSWNISNFGRTRIEKYQNIDEFAKILRDADLILIQEIVAKDPAGARAVALLADELNRTGSSWDYVVSEPTKLTSPQMKERYAFIWKRSKLKLAAGPFLISAVESIAYREPFLAEFNVDGNKLVVLNYHSRKYNDNPEIEIKPISEYLLKVDSGNRILAGDFNLSEDHEVFNRMYNENFSHALTNQGTTLKKKCVGGNYLNHSIDNFYYRLSDFKMVETGIIDIIQDCDLLLTKRYSLSDHVPIFMKISY